MDRTANLNFMDFAIGVFAALDLQVYVVVVSGKHVITPVARFPCHRRCFLPCMSQYAGNVSLRRSVRRKYLDFSTLRIVIDFPFGCTN